MPLAPLVLALSLAAVGRAQETAPESPKPAAAPAAASEARPTPRGVTPPSATLQVQIVISRFLGDRKVASLPYGFFVQAVPVGVGARERVRMRMGIDTPVPKTAVVGDAKGSVGTTEVQYRNVGTNIDCWVYDLGDGRYQVNSNVENSSALVGSEAGSGPATASGPPLFRRFDAFINPILRPGQTLQAMASTDPVTGEVVKIDVTISVVK
jgi:glucose/arabinose dehydrogenase